MSDMEDRIRSRAELTDKQTPLPLPEIIQTDIRRWYNIHSTVYARIFDKLDRVRKVFSRVSRGEKIAMVKASYVYAVLTQRVQIDIAEEEWREITSGIPLLEVMEGEPMGTQKPNWILRGLDTPALWGNVVGLLRNGRVMEAEDRLRAGAVGLGIRKAPFTLTQLGFTQLMCVDSNISRLLDITVESDADVDAYRGVCYQIEEAFPELMQLVKEPYHLQWVLFDYQRYHRLDPPEGEIETTMENPIEAHRNWFSSVLGDTKKLERRMDRMTEVARAESR